ncbi:SDR family oxidoreductase [Luteolibacter sp. Populi]|uniref:SDR family oxidoreductase n=1 Tax=Luteolibacter sp. Populi TaxID=3230487 RepID=UPI00346720EF
MIAITGATGQLGRLVIAELLKSTPAGSLVAIVRDPAKAADFTASGVVVRQADYADRASLEAAFAGVAKLLLISSNELGSRATQHANAIAAAKTAGVSLLAYTSVLHADRSPLGLAAEHLETEQILAASGLPYAILRNGWYTENYTGSIPAALAHGVLAGSAGAGRISSAARQDYAEAAAKVLTGSAGTARIYELAGDESYTLADLAAEISKQSGKTVPYQDLPEADYAALLLKAGLPSPVAGLIASSDRSAAEGALFDDSRELSKLIARPTTPLAESVRQALLG